MPPGWRWVASAVDTVTFPAGWGPGQWKAGAASPRLCLPGDSCGMSGVGAPRASWMDAVSPGDQGKVAGGSGGVGAPWMDTNTELWPQPCPQDGRGSDSLSSSGSVPAEGRSILAASPCAFADGIELSWRIWSALTQALSRSPHSDLCGVCRAALGVTPHPWNNRGVSHPTPILSAPTPWPFPLCWGGKHQPQLDFQMLIGL